MKKKEKYKEIVILPIAKGCHRLYKIFLSLLHALYFKNKHKPEQNPTAKQTIAEEQRTNAEQTITEEQRTTAVQTTTTEQPITKEDFFILLLFISFEKKTVSCEKIGRGRQPPPTPF